MKLNQKQLRTLINEAIQGRQPGSPLWEPTLNAMKLNQKQLRQIIQESIQGRQPGSPLWEAPGDETFAGGHNQVPNHGSPLAEGPRNPKVQRAIQELAMVLSEDLAGDDFEPDEFLPEVQNDISSAVTKVWSEYGGR